MEAIQYTAAELAFAQICLNYYPNQCGFWDTPSGQDVLSVARQESLEAKTTNRQRWDFIYSFRDTDPENDGWLASHEDAFRDWRAANGSASPF